MSAASSRVSGMDGSAGDSNDAGVYCGAVWEKAEPVGSGAFVCSGSATAG